MHAMQSYQGSVMRLTTEVVQEGTVVVIIFDAAMPAEKNAVLLANVTIYCSCPRRLGHAGLGSGP